METAILTSIVAGSSALLGVALTSFIQFLTLKNNQEFQIALEASKRESELREKEKFLAFVRLAEAHRKLNIIGREFSLTSLNINWRAEMKDTEYDQRYLSVCEEVDELRVIISLYEPSLSEDVESLYGQMNIFWGNFNNILYLTSLGKKVDHTMSCFQNAHATAEGIGRQVRTLKFSLNECANRYRANG
jgi:hypothetical protein